MLPDGKTLIKVDGGGTEKIIIEDLMSLYKNSSKINYRRRAARGGGDISSQSILAQPFGQVPENDKKSLNYKIMQALEQFCMEECTEKDAIETILITGGMLNLKCQGKKFAKVLQKDVERSIDKIYNMATVTYADEPECGSILNGAKILVSLP